MSGAAGSVERVDDDDGREPPSSNVYHEEDYLPSVWYSPMYWNSPVANVSSSSSSGRSTSGGSSSGGTDHMDMDIDMADSREQDDMQLERETDHEDTVFDRAAGPLKRGTVGKEETTQAILTTEDDPGVQDQINQQQGEENQAEQFAVVRGPRKCCIDIVHCES